MRPKLVWDSAMAPRMRPFANGEAARKFTLRLPPDCPQMVILSGSPPKAAILFFTHLNGGQLIERSIVARYLMIGFPRQLRVREPAEDVDSVVQRHHYDALLCHFVAAIPRIAAPAADTAAA